MKRLFDDKFPARSEITDEGSDAMPGNLRSGKALNDYNMLPVLGERH